jgi:hypothetical protein
VYYLTNIARPKFCGRNVFCIFMIIFFLLKNTILWVKNLTSRNIDSALNEAHSKQHLKMALKFSLIRSCLISLLLIFIKIGRLKAMCVKNGQLFMAELN